MKLTGELDLDPITLQVMPFDEAKHSALLGPLTDLLHAAYKPLADKGLRYSATHQPPEKTLERLRGGRAFLPLEKAGLSEPLRFFHQNRTAFANITAGKGFFISANMRWTPLSKGGASAAGFWNSSKKGPGPWAVGK